MALFNCFFVDVLTTLVRKHFIILVFLFIYFFNGFAQIPELKINYLSKEEGLLNLNINYVTQDSVGFIWIASTDGLFRYDGYNFTKYTSIQNDSSTLSHNNIFSLYTDSKGRLWVGTMQGLCRYNDDFDNFDRLSDLDRFADIVDRYVTLISEDQKGNILISCNNYIFQYNEVNHKFSPLLSIENGEIKHFVVDKSNIIWIACSGKQGLKKFNLNTKKWEAILPPGNDFNDLSTSSISCLSMDNGKLWMATAGEGIKMFDTKSLKYTRYPFEKGDASMAIFTYIDNKKNVWTVDLTGLKILDKQTGTFISYYPKLNDPKSIKRDVKGIFQDKQGNYWIYHGPKGIGISMALKGFRYFTNDIDDFWHTSGENISALQEDSKGNLWIGSAEGGITVFDYQKQVIINYQYNEHDKFSVGKGGIGCIFRDSKGIMWISSYYAGLQYFDSISRRFISYNHNPKDSSSIAGNDIRSIAEDSEGNLWMVVHGKGVDKFDRKQSKFIHYTCSQNNLSKEWTNQLLIDFKGDLWVATSWGLNYLKKGDNKFKTYFADLNDTTGLSNSFINTIYEDNQHILWIGTESGLNRYNRSRNNFTQYSKIFNNNNISGILCDNDNNLWVSTLSGLAMFNYKKKQVKNFGLVDGLITDEFNQRACYKTILDELYFGGTKGIVIFKPHELKYNTTPPFVYLDKIKVLDNEIKVSHSDYMLQKNISRAEKITLLYSDKVITFYFKALNFINPQLNQYAYMLEGFDETWKYSGKNREATYTNLDPGTYIFRVKASNNDGYWNDEGASIKIIILPPWWQTWWFRSIVAVIFLSLFYLIYYARLSFYRIQQKKLTEMVRERTKELEETAAQLEERQEEIKHQNEELIVQRDKLFSANETLSEQKQKILEQNLELDKHRYSLESIVEERTHELIIAKEKAEESDKLKTSFLANLSHEIRTPLNAIVGFSILATDTNITEPERKRYLQIISNNNETLLTLINNILDFSIIESGNIEIDYKEVKLSNIISDIKEVFNLQLKQFQTNNNKPVELKISISEELLNTHFITDKNRLKQVLTNLLNNALKFTEEGYIEIGCYKLTENNTLLFYLKDTGIGIKPEHQDIIFNRFRKIEDNKDKLHRGTGLGLAISQQLVNLIGGEIWVESKPNSGSTFYFDLPLKQVTSNDKEFNSNSNKESITEIPSLKGISILVAEDDLANYLFIEKLLKKTQAEIIHAIDGNQAVLLAQNNPNIQLILMDIKMPKMDGIEAFHAIKAIGINVPVIAQTAYAFTNEIDKLLKEGFTDCITKPIHPNQLFKVIANRILNQNTNET